MSKPKVSISSIRHQGQIAKSIPKHSGFLITINTQIKPENQDEAKQLANDLEEAMKAAFDEDNIGNFIEFIDEGTKHKWSTDYIESVKGEFTVELGQHAKGGRIHGHAAIHIDHYSKIRLDQGELRVFLNDYLADNSDFPVKKIHLNIRHISEDSNLHRYIHKGPVVV
jgi:hypothetical protein